MATKKKVSRSLKKEGFSKEHAGKLSKEQCPNCGQPEIKVDGEVIPCDCVVGIYNEDDDNDDMRFHFLFPGINPNFTFGRCP